MGLPAHTRCPLRRTQTKGSAIMAERTIYRYVPHRRTEARLAGEPPSPVKVVDQLPTGGKPATLVSWIPQTFLQLVLLSVIIVGQNVLAAAADKRSEATYNDADAVLHEAVKIQEHLVAQDKVLSALIDKAQGLPG